MTRKKIAKRLHLLPYSKTFRRYLQGELSAEVAEKIGRSMEYRHTKTPYDSLLAAGFTKDEARKLIQ